MKYFTETENLTFFFQWLKTHSCGNKYILSVLSSPPHLPSVTFQNHFILAASVQYLLPIVLFRILHTCIKGGFLCNNEKQEEMHIK